MSGFPSLGRRSAPTLLVMLPLTLTTTPTQAAPTVTLEPVTVTASGTAQPVGRAAASVSIITPADLQRYPSVLAAIGQLAGVDLVGGSSNGTEIAIRGLPGEYTLILIDGKRQSMRETRARDTGGVEPYLLPPPEAIERIEVVRGPMSALYGADAIGGVINIITRPVPTRWRGAVRAGTVLQQHHELGNTSEGSFTLGGPLVHERLGLQIDGGIVHRDEDNVYFPASGSSGTNGRTSRQLSATLAWTLTPMQQLRLRGAAQSLRLKSTPGHTAAPTVASSEVRFERRQLVLSHEGTWAFGTSSVSLNHETGREKRWSGDTFNPVLPKVQNTTLDGRLAFDLDTHQLTIGSEFTRSRLNGIGKQQPIPNYPANGDGATARAWAFYAEDQWQIAPQFTLTTGMRLDHDQRYGSHWSPRLHGVWQPAPDWTIRGGIASGFKAPTLRQSTDGYCVTTGLPGNVAVAAQAGTLCGSSDLKPETSLTQELGVRHTWDEARSHIGLTVFHTQFKNRVASYNTGLPDPLLPQYQIYVYDNISRVRLRGIELEGRQSWPGGWSLSASYTYTHSRRQGGGEPAYDGTSLDGWPLEKTPRHSFKAQLDWQATQQLNLYARTTVQSAQYFAGFRNSALHVRRRPGSATVDLGANLTLTPDWNIGLAVLNVADRRVPVDTRGRLTGLDGNWLVDEGRRLWLTTDVRF